MEKEYKDIKTKLSNNCTLCNCSLKNNDSPWSICYDSEWRHNSWGGDTHEFRGLLCQNCVEKLLIKKVQEEKTFTFNEDKPEETGFYLVKLVEKSKYKMYREYDIDFFDVKIGWRRWSKEEVERWSEITEEEKSDD